MITGSSSLCLRGCINTGQYFDKQWQNRGTLHLYLIIFIAYHIGGCVYNYYSSFVYPPVMLSSPGCWAAHEYEARVWVANIRETQLGSESAKLWQILETTQNIFCKYDPLCGWCFQSEKKWNTFVPNHIIIFHPLQSPCNNIKKNFQGTLYHGETKFIL